MMQRREREGRGRQEERTGERVSSVALAVIQHSRAIAQHHAEIQRPNSPGHIFFGGSTAEVAFEGTSRSPASNPLEDMGSSFSENIGSLMSAGACCDDMASWSRGDKGRGEERETLRARRGFQVAGDRDVVQQSRAEIYRESVVVVESQV